MRYLSICSGIEAASVAWGPLGWEPVGFSEIEPFPSAVLEHQYPGVPNFGDMTEFNQWEIDYGAVDLVCGGTPCQGFSVAGLRKGMDDDRSNLCLNFLQIVKRSRPRWVVWENVPGCLSTNGGRDFGSFVGGLGQLGYGWAYRTLDAQYVRVDGYERAVPQRRRRVFVVGYSGDWRPAAAVLFERNCLSGDPAPSREAGKGVARNLTSSPGGCSAKEQQHTFVGSDGNPLNPLCMAHGQGNAEISKDDSVPTLTCNHEPPVVCYENHPNDSRVKEHGSLSPTLTQRTGTGGGNLPLVAFQRSELRLNGKLTNQEVAPTLKAETKKGDTELTVAFSEGYFRCGSGHAPRSDGTVNTIQCNTGDQRTSITNSSIIRRLTPMECERLQGFPDGWTRIPWRNKPADQCPDGPRYKALGNSWAVNCARWIGQRIEMANGGEANDEF